MSAILDSHTPGVNDLWCVQLPLQRHLDIRVITGYVAPAYPREQQEAAYVTRLSDRW
jgi:hypothetical protein